MAASTKRRRVAEVALGVALGFLCALAATGTSQGAPTTKKISAGAIVDKVSGKGKSLVVQVHRGSKGGLQVGSTGALYPMRISQGSKTPSVQFGIRLATGRVIKVQPDTAFLRVEGAIGEIKPGAYFEYHMAVPENLAASPLFRITALGVDLKPQMGSRPFVSLEELLGNPSEAKRDAVVDAMVADIKSIKAVIESTMSKRVVAGRYHGKTPAEIVDGLDRRQLRDFLGFVEAYPGKYIAHKWSIPEVFMTWIINEAPSGERDRLLRQASATVARAHRDARNGKFFDAKKRWTEVLASVPDYEFARKKIASIDKLLLLRRQLQSDPDDTSTRFAVANELFDLGAYEQGLAEVEELAKRNYDGTTTEKYRGYFLVRLERWRDAKAVFQKLAKEHPKNENIQHWNRYTIAMAAVAQSPGDPEAHFKLARVKEESKSWNDALTQYRLALDSNRITTKQRELAIAAQQRISLEQNIEKQLEWAREAIKVHKTTSARTRIEGAIVLMDALKQPDRAGEILNELATLAMTSHNPELAIELYREVFKRLPKAIESYSSLAYGLLVFDRLDEAEKTIQEGLKLEGKKGYPYLILSDIARARLDWKAVERYAKLAIANSSNYPWPRINLARVEAEANRWTEARRLAEEALELDRDEWKIQSTYTAVLRGEDAYEALRADPNSARERLRLIRALADLGLANRVAKEIALLPSSDTWKSEAWWALATSADVRLLQTEQLKAARSAAPTTPYRKRKLAQLEAQVAMRSNPNDVATGIKLARLYLESEGYDLALATATPLQAIKTNDALQDIEHAARKGLTMSDQIALAYDALSRGDYQAGLQITNTIVESAEAIGTLAGRVRANDVRADALAALGRYREAIDLMKASEALLRNEGNAIALDLVERRMASFQASIGTSDAIQKALERSLALCERLDYEEGLYFVHKHLASIESSEGRTASAVEHGRRAWKIAERLGRLDYARAARFALADANLAANRFGDSKRLAESLLKDSREHSDVIHEQYSLMVLGEVEAMRGNGQAARKLFEEVYDLGTRNGKNEWRALARHFQGAAWLKADRNPAKAVGLLEHSAELYKSLGDGWAVAVSTRVLRDLADAQLQAGKIASARQTAEESLKLANQFQNVIDLAFSEWVLAMISVEEGKGTVAVAHAERSVGHAKKTDSVDLLWRAYYAHGLAHRVAGKKEQALASFERALEHVQRALEATGGESEQAGYMNVGRVRQLYKDTVKLLLEMKKTSRAMEVLEISRDAQLRQVLDPANIETDDKNLKAQLEKYKKTRARGVGLEGQLAKALEKPKAQQSKSQQKQLGERIARNREELNQVAVGLKLSHRSIFQALVIKPQNLVDRRNELPNGAVVAEYFVTDDMLYVFVVSAGSSEPAVLQIPVSAKVLNDTIAEFREAIVSEPEEVEALGRKLGTWLLKPLDSHIEGASTLIVMPFGPLYYVPFDALVTSEEGKPTRYAIEDLRISVQTSDTLEKLLAKSAAPKAGTMLAVSNPDGSLPGAGREVKRIVKAALPDAKVLARKNATVKNFQSQAGAYRYLHLATHGVLSHDASKTHLKMSDGPLSVLQIAGLKGLKENNDIVVLSACNTALEENHTTGDALVSLASGFALAGAPTLLASLWEVPDTSTPELMAAFYRAIEKAQGDKLDALRSAKLNLLRMQRGSSKPFASPWHWASFQLYGDYRARGTSASSAN